MGLAKKLNPSEFTYYTLPMLGMNHTKIPGFLTVVANDPDYPQWDNHIHLMVHKPSLTQGVVDMLLDHPLFVGSYLEANKPEEDDAFPDGMTFVYSMPEKWKSFMDKYLDRDESAFLEESAVELCALLCEHYPLHATAIESFFQVAKNAGERRLEIREACVDKNPLEDFERLMKLMRQL